MKNILPILIALPLFTSPIKSTSTTKSTPRTRYNLCIFVRFQDEEEHINDIVTNTLTRRDIVDNTYNHDTYSVRDYYRSLSSDTMDLKTVYLFPNQTGFDSFLLDRNRESYAIRSDTNPNGYENVTLAGQQLREDWGSKVQAAINQGILPCSIHDRNDTISYADLDSDGNGTIDSLTVLYAPQLQTNFETYRQQPLYPCMETNSYIKIPLSNGKTLTSQDYDQWTPNYSSIIRQNNSTDYFLPFSTGCHEMGHMFGYRDLYDYNQRIFPVGYMSLMSNMISPIPQFMTCYEREISSWIDPGHIGMMRQSGTYTLTAVKSDNQDGICCYKVPILECPDKWLYLEYRNFQDTSINRYDARNKNLVNLDGSAVSYISGKSGVVCYLVDKDAKYPTNSVGNAKYLGLEVLGGTTTSQTRSDAPRTEGDVVNVCSYDKNGTIQNPNLKITIDAITNTEATFTLSYPSIDNFREISSADIGNDKVYQKLSSLSTDLLSNTSLDEVETLDLTSLEIQDLDFLNLFTLQRLKYLCLAGNEITDVSPLFTFLNNHPSLLVILDDNEISLSMLPETQLNSTQVFYGLQNTRKNQEMLEYCNSSSFSSGSYQVTYQYEDENQKSLRNEGYGTLTLKPNVSLHIKSYYFFSDRNSLSHEYDTIYQTTIEEEPIALSLNGSSTIILEYPEEYVEQGVTTNYPDDLVTTIEKDNVIVSEIKEVGTYLITYTVTHNGSSESVTRTVIIQEPVLPSLTLKGEETYIGLEYQEPGYEYPEDSSLNIRIQITDNNGRETNEIKDPGTYKITYCLMKESTLCDTKNRTVILLSPEEVINHPEYASFFTIQEEYYLLDGTKALEEPTQGEYDICYTIQDHYGNTKTYTEHRSLPIILPPEPDSDSSETPSSSSPVSSSSPDSNPVSSSPSVPESQEENHKDEPSVLYIILGVISPVVVLVPLLLFLLKKKKH